MIRKTTKSYVLHFVLYSFEVMLILSSLLVFGPKNLLYRHVVELCGQTEGEFLVFVRNEAQTKPKLRLTSLDSQLR